MSAVKYVIKNVILKGGKWKKSWCFSVNKYVYADVRQNEENIFSFHVLIEK